MSKEVVYFELNNWFCGRDYPDDEPFATWLGDDLNLYFSDDDWVKENKLCVVESYIDMSTNYCITATKEWVEQNCPKLLTEYAQFLRKRDEDGDVYGKWGHQFLNYEECNIGILFVLEQTDSEDDDEDDGH